MTRSLRDPRSAVPDDAGPRVRPGREPATARTVVWLRAVLAAAALIGFAFAAVAFALAAGREGGTRTGEYVAAALCALVALTALVDLVLLAVRSWRGAYRHN